MVTRRPETSATIPKPNFASAWLTQRCPILKFMMCVFFSPRDVFVSDEGLPDILKYPRRPLSKKWGGILSRNGQHEVLALTNLQVDYQEGVGWYSKKNWASP